MPQIKSSPLGLIIADKVVQMIKRSAIQVPRRKQFVQNTAIEIRIHAKISKLQILGRRVTGSAQITEAHETALVKNHRAVINISYTKIPGKRRIDAIRAWANFIPPKRSFRGHIFFLQNAGSESTYSSFKTLPQRAHNLQHFDGA